MRLYSYDRTSVADFRKVSNAAQYQSIIQRATADYETLPHRFSDRGQSGGTVNRPDFQKLQKEITSSDESGVLLVWRYDRIARNVNDAMKFLEKCQKHNIDVVSLSEPLPESGASFATKKMFVQLLFINAEMQRNTIIENVRSGIAYKKNQKKYISSAVPFGFRLKEGDLVQEPMEARAVRRLFDLYTSGNYGYQRLANQLNKEGFFFYDKEFKKHTVRMILNNPIYFGRIKGGSFGSYQGDFDPIISKETFDNAQAIRKSRQKARANPRIYPLRNKIQCPDCGWKLSCRWSKSESGKRINHYYFCANRSCNGITIRADELEDKVLDLMRRFVDQEEIFSGIQKALLLQIRGIERSQRVRQRDFETERRTILKKFEEGDLSLEEMKEALAEVAIIEKPKIWGYEKDKMTKSLQRLLKLKEGPIQELFFDQIEIVHLAASKEITGFYIQGINQNLIERMDFNGD